MQNSLAPQRPSREPDVQERDEERIYDSVSEEEVMEETGCPPDKAVSAS